MLKNDKKWLTNSSQWLRDAFKKKNYVDRETVPIPSYPPTIETVSEYLDREYWSVFLPPLPTSVIGKLGQKYRERKTTFFSYGCV